jgi:hypothetical protein
MTQRDLNSGGSSNRFYGYQPTKMIACGRFQSWKNSLNPAPYSASYSECCMPEIGLDRPRIVAVVGEFVAAGVAQHVGMRLDARIGRGGCPLDHAGEAGRR